MSAEAPPLLEPSVEPLRLEPGIYYGMPYSDYHRVVGLRASVLGAFVDATPAHVRHYIDHGEDKDATKYTDRGHALHLAVLEPGRFAETFVLQPKVGKRSNKDKTFWAEWQEKHRDHLTLSEDELQRVTGMRDSLLAHHTARAVLQSAGTSEVIVVWEEKTMDGKPVRCKARIDRLATLDDEAIVADLKTARSAHRNAFERAVFDYRYFVQASHYLAGVEALYPTPAGNPRRKFLFLVVESDAPYCAAVYEMDELALDIGERLRQQFLREFERCTRSGIWPGYSDDPQLVGLPQWTLKRLENGVMDA